MGGETAYAGIGHGLAGDAVAGARQRGEQTCQRALYAWADDDARGIGPRHELAEPFRTGFAIMQGAAELLVAQQAVDVVLGQAGEARTQALLQGCIRRFRRHVHGHVDGCGGNRAAHRTLRLNLPH